MAYQPIVLREGQCWSWIALVDTDIDLYCDLDEGHGSDHVCLMPGEGLVMGRDWDVVVGNLGEVTPEMEARLKSDVEVRWSWPKEGAHAEA